MMKLFRIFYNVSPETKFRILIVTSSLFLQFMVYSLYNITEGSGVFEYWKLSFFALTIITILLTIALFFLKKTLGYIFLLIVFVLSLLKVYPLGFVPMIDILVSASVLLLLPLYFNSRVVFIISSLLSSGFIFIHRTAEVWNFKIISMSKTEIINLSAILLFLCFLLTLITRIIEENQHLSRSLEQQNRSVTKLSQANLSFQDYANRVGEQEKVLERTRIANDLHDSIGYTLTNIRLLMEAALTMNKDEWDEIQNSIKTTSTLARDGLRNTKEALLDLSQIEQGRDWGLAAQHELTKAFSVSTGVRVNFESGNVPWNIDSKIDYAVFHMIQESMTNSLRHGKATEVHISMWIHDNLLSISIEDNGTGNAESSTGMGLEAMRGRIEQLNGTLQVRERSNGYYLNARISLKGVQ